MIIGALVTMVFFFAYTTVRTPAQNVGFSCAVNFCLVSSIIVPIGPNIANVYPRRISITAAYTRTHRKCYRQLIAVPAMESPLA
jgi:hypothetical protein